MYRLELLISSSNTMLKLLVILFVIKQSLLNSYSVCRGRSSTAATSKMERFVIIIVNGFQPLTIITKRSILDVAAVLDLPLRMHAQRCEPQSIHKIQT